MQFYMLDINIDLMLYQLCDAPRPWGIYFQDSASPQMEALVELHNIIMFYLVTILFVVGWMLFTIIRNFVHYRWPISNKYLNHGKDVPIHKYSKIKNSALINKKYTRSYSSTSSDEEGNDLNVEKKYEDAFTMKKDILKENEGKSGIYMLTNKITKDTYIGQSTDLKKRFTNYFNISYLKSKNNLIISRALIKYGYSNFSVSILEYCNKTDLLKREQYYFDKLNPQYNILKIAGSSLSYKHSEETRLKISKKLKGIYVKEKSALYGRYLTEETKKIMSLKKIGENNNMYDKVHTEKTKELIRLKALGRKHSEETKLKMSAAQGNLVHIYEKCDSEGFKLIGSFVSIRRAAKFLEISASTIKRYINSGEMFKDRYKFTSESL